MDKRLIGELTGTLALIFAGNGVNASVLAKTPAGEYSDWMVITTGQALLGIAGGLTAIACGLLYLPTLYELLLWRTRIV